MVSLKNFEVSVLKKEQMNTVIGGYRDTTYTYLSGPKAGLGGEDQNHCGNTRNTTGPDAGTSHGGDSTQDCHQGFDPDHPNTGN